MLVNDANATTLAGTIEYPDAKVLVGITNGTGIGCGIAIDSKLFTGANGLLGEIYGNPLVCSNNSVTKIGRIVSGSKILKKLNHENDKEIIHQSALYLGTLLVQIIHLYNPDVLYFSGGGFTYFDGYLEKAIQFAKDNCYPAFLENLIFKQSTYDSYSGCFGAIKLVSERIG